MTRRATVSLVVAMVAFAGCGESAPREREREDGRLLLRQFGCGSCHRIPGVAGASGEVGPSLQHFGRRTYVAGILPNTPGNVQRFIRDPQSVDPRTAMPNLQVGEAHARAMAAYLGARMRRLATWIAAAAVGLVALAGALVYSGVYDVSATDQHLGPTYHVLDVAMRRAVKVRAAGIRVPPLDDAALVARGRSIYARHCAQCHGAPGVAPEPFALGLTPAAANLAPAGAEWPPAEIFWVVKHGLKMTGMPAWEFRLPEADLWAVVAFVKALPRLSPEDYRAMVPSPPDAPVPEAGPGDAQRGRVALQQYACVTCHQIPGIVGANAPVGPSLDRIASRALIAGSLPNTGANLEAFLRAPHAYKPLGAMPDLGVTPRDARDMAAYLATLR